MNTWTGADARRLRKVALRMTLREFADHLGVSHRTISKWEQAGASRVPRPHMQAILDTALNRADDEARARFMAAFDPRDVDLELVRPVTMSPVAFDLSRYAENQPETTDEFAAAAEESARFAARMEASNVGVRTMEQLESDLHRVIGAYPHRPVEASFAEVRALRDRTFNLLEGRQPPRFTRDLYLAASVLCGVLANACFDTGRYAAAETQARTAFVCGELAGHNGMRAWVRGTQALVAYWDGRPADAARLAGEATRFTPEHGTAGVRAHSIHARALAQLGDHDRALTALAAADEAAQVVQTGSLFTGMLDFPRGKQLFYGATAHLWLGGPEHAEAAQHLAQEAVEVYEQAPPQHRRLGELSLARLDLASARLALDDAEGAVDALGEVVTISAVRPTESVARRAEQLGRDLLTHPVLTSRAGVVLQELVGAAQTRPALGGAQ